MSENFYENVLQFVLEEIHKSYIAQNNESEFVFYYKMNYVEETKDTITVSTPSSLLHQMMLKRNIFDIVEKKICEATGQSNIKLKCIIKSEEESVSSASTSNNISTLVEETKIEQPVIQPEKTKHKHPQLNDLYTFDTFIPGDNCKYAYNASIAIAKDPGKEKNPVLIYGGPGLGKTHLMQAIGNFIYENNPKMKICYVSAESFTNEFLESLKTKKTTEFKNKYRNVDVLLLDDIHFLQKKEQTQEELFYTFNALAEKKSQMVFTCDRPLNEIKEMEDRLISRLNMGLSIDIQAPKYEDRYAILQKKLDILGKTFDSEIIDYIAKNIESNVRDLEGALKDLIAYNDLVDKVDLETAKSLLKNRITESDNAISIETIEKVIAENYQISIAELKGRKREKRFVIPRQYAQYIAKEITEMTFSEIAEEFGGKDHTTIMHSCNKISELIKIDSSLKNKIDLMIKQIKEYRK